MWVCHRSLCSHVLLIIGFQVYSLDEKTEKKAGESQTEEFGILYFSCMQEIGWVLLHCDRIPPKLRETHPQITLRVWMLSRNFMQTS